MKYKHNILFCSLVGCMLWAGAMQAQSPLNVPEELSTLSTSSVKGEQLLKMPTTNFTNSLFGLLPGLTVLQGGGMNNASLNIRGLGSYNYPSVTYFIDGYQSDFILLSPSEIESITVLKDAAALAPFGMKGAHGIVWITTKRGTEGKPVVGVDFQTGVQMPTVLSKPLSATEYAQLYNEAYSNDAGAWTSFYNIPNDVKYNTDWYDKVLKKSALFDRQDVSIRGGSANTKYFVLLGHAGNSGLYASKNDDSHSSGRFDQYLVKANLDFSMLKIFEGNVNINGRIEDRKSPNYNEYKLWQNLASYPNIIYPAQNPNGSFPGTAIHPDNPYASIRSLGIKQLHDRTLGANFNLKEKLDFITPGLYIQQGVSLSSWTRGTRIVSRDYSRMFNGVAQTTHRDSNYKVNDDWGTNQWNRLQFLLGAGYAREFGQNTFQTVVNYLQYVYNIDDNLNGKAGLNNNYAYQNIGGRVFYDWNKRVSAEFGFAFGGSDNYKKGNRFGFYHALSAAYQVFNEQHPSANANINRLKLRASVGTTGNDVYNEGRYLYERYYGSYGGGGFATGNDDPSWHSAIGLKYVPNEHIFAEKAYKYNVGAEAKFFNKWDVMIEAFLNKHEGIISPDYSISSVFGATPPYKNIGKVTNRGFEVSTLYSNAAGKLTYSIGANASFAKNKIDYMAEYDATSESSAQTGRSIGTRFGYEATGFYDINDFDSNGNLLPSLPKPSFGNVAPGDVKYRDLNGDNRIDPADKTEIGKSYLPTLTYAGTLNLGYEGFDLGVLVQGVQGREVNLLDDARQKTVAFENNGNVYAIAKNRWAYYPAQGIDTRSSAQYPRLSLLSNNNNTQPSTLWIKKANYLRVRYIELGYSVPKRMLDEIGVSKLRIYVNAANPFTFSSLLTDYDLDPEVLSGYPALKSVTMGVSLKF